MTAASPLPELAIQLTTEQLIGLFAGQVAAHADIIMDTGEAAQFTRLSAGTLREMAAAGKIPHWRAGKEYRFARSELLKLCKGTK